MTNVLLTPGGPAALRSLMKQPEHLELLQLWQDVQAYCRPLPENRRDNRSELRRAIVQGLRRMGALPTPEGSSAAALELEEVKLDVSSEHEHLRLQRSLVRREVQERIEHTLHQHYYADFAQTDAFRQLLKQQKDASQAVGPLFLCLGSTALLPCPAVAASGGGIRDAQRGLRRPSAS